MNCTLKRNEFSENGIFGILFDDTGKQLAVTLERSWWDASAGWQPKIPVGTWTFKRYLSPHLGYEVFMCSDIPGHDFIEMHIANEENQLDGCVALGMERQGNEVLESKIAFTNFRDVVQAGVDSFQLTVENG